jgi:zinc-dependent metalloproteinase lipoprotein
MKKVALIIISIIFLYSCKKTDKIEDTVGKLPVLPSSQILEYPVIFHIIHEGAPVGTGDNIPAAWVQFYMDNLNRYFSGQSTLGNNTNFKFRLARKNPSDVVLAEPGIDRINLGAASYPEATILGNPLWGKNLAWNPTEYINIFIVDLSNGGAFGWTMLPNSSSKNIVKGLEISDNENFANCTNSQSIFIRKSSMSYYYSINFQGRTELVHEMGHYFGLDHIFRNGCTANGDYVDDTYDYDYSTANTSTDTRRACSNGANYTSINFMDYTITGGSQFTNGQIERMRQVASWSPFRKDVWKSVR